MHGDRAERAERGERGESCGARGQLSWRVAVLGALCLLPRAPGHAQLPPPQNVTLVSKAFEMILTWTPGEGSPPDVTFTVRYKSEDHMDKWIKVPHCKNIPRTSCILTCMISNIYVRGQAQVKAVSGRLQSPWVKSQFKAYFSEVELAPPVLILNVKENSIQVNASFPVPTCVENLTLKYELNHWEAGSEDKPKKYEGYRKDSVTIDTPALRSNHCFSARALYDSSSSKHSEFSQPVCVPLNHKGEWKFPLPAAILVFVLPIFLTGAFILCFLKQDAKQRKMPQALDFHHFRAAGPAYPLELSGKEFCRDDLSCREKPLAQRRADRALARHSLPWVAPLLSPPPSPASTASGGMEDEDSGTFIPYNQVTRFPKSLLHCQPSQAAQGKTSSDSASGGLSVHSESVLDLGALGFPFFPERKDEVDTSGSPADEEESLPHRCSLERISLSDVRFPESSDQYGADRDGSLEMTPLQPLMEGVYAKHPPHQHHPQKADHFSRYYQRHGADLQAQIRGISQLSEDPNIQLLIPLGTLQVAEDEGIASDCGSDSFTEGTPPPCTVLSDPFGPSDMGGKHDQKFEFRGYSHAHYLGRI